MSTLKINKKSEREGEDSYGFAGWKATCRPAGRREPLFVDSAAQRIALLAAKGEVLFHAQDLASLWKIENRNTLRVTLARYSQKGLLHRVHRGFYSLLSLEQLDPIRVGSKALHRFCYLSTETVLYEAGYLSQKPYAYTFLSEKSLHFQIGPWSFLSRQLQPVYLYNSEGIDPFEGIQKANPDRAIADMLYFNPKIHFDRPVNWIKIRQIQSLIGYPLTHERYASSQA